ncbi:hypothetical protein AB0A60_19545 [Streptomyces sp. NPDC046275]|uniref:hypothetical protein n=1 Tax=Streptomyces sp. NPDC046275 TaxID=3157201 RepID=UPI0033CC4CD8
MTAPAVERLVVSSGAELLDHIAEKSGPPRTAAADMGDLARAVRAVLGVDRGQGPRVPLGGGLFDVVITAASVPARAAVDLMDGIQGGCGPVVEDPDNGWLYWLVPPRTGGRWAPHEHAVHVGPPHRITLPPRGRCTPPGPYWLRPPATDRLVPIGPLWGVLAQLRPEPAPHAALAASGITP